MFGTPHRPLAGVRAFAPLSVFALLAFLCLPTLAVAKDSAGAVYEEAVPTVPSGGSAGSSGAGGVGAGGQSSGDGSGSSGSGGSATDGSSSDDDKSGGAASGKGDRGNGQGSQAGGASNRSGVGEGHAIASPDRAAISHDGGSSPLVPILIALAVLAAISIGVVTMRRRNQDGGPGAKSGSFSPEAG